MMQEILTSTSTITFPDGLIGCEEWIHFNLESDPETAPLLLLKSLDDHDLAFIVCDARLFVPDYDPQLTKVDLKALENPQAEDLIVLVIITPPPLQKDKTAPAETTLTVNLLGPLILNLEEGVGRQVLHSDYDAHVPFNGDLSC